MQEQNLGMDMSTQRALQGSAVGNAAQADATKTLQGGYLNPANNPSLQQALGYGQSQVMKSYGNQLGRNFGNSGVNSEIGESMGRVSSGLYDNERNRMMQSQVNAPNLANLDYADLSALLGVGDTKQAQQQQLLDAGRNEWSNALNNPINNLNTLMTGLQGSQGYGSTTSPNPYQSSRAANAIGGAMTGFGATGSPWGAAIGGIGGLLL